VTGYHRINANHTLKRVHIGTILKADSPVAERLRWVIPAENLVSGDEGRIKEGGLESYWVVQPACDRYSLLVVVVKEKTDRNEPTPSQECRERN